MAVSNAYADNVSPLQGHSTPSHHRPRSSRRRPLLDRVTLQAKIILRYTKKYKDDGSHNHVIVLDSVDNPLKLLLAHGLRRWVVKDANSAEEAAQAALVHPRKPMKRRDPDRPVICFIAVLNEAGQLPGITQRLVTHDVRRGAAADAVRLQSRTDVDNATHAMDHTANAVTAGVSTKYIGHGWNYHWEERLQFEPEDAFAL
ncbi:hypothetical protein E8E11_002836 [Didymella keratinophila]|nr:hypothetical protein E8E11_002836 [Didymella keratinophila]